MNATDMVHAAGRLGVTLFLSTEGPAFKLPDRDKLNKSQWDALRQLRLVMSRHRDMLIRHLGGNPDVYKWTPAEGTEERTWYDHLVACSKENEGGVSEGQTGRRWHHLKDAKRLLEACRNTDEWKKEARSFWWDTTHAKSYRTDDYDWPINE